ncbi:MAG: acetyl-CoA carboxylase biotin carboxyl carrier protein [Firmicutes bacterium]|jgi:acetyl-CoA carboxylase biotin carboxyl carrier protein|nr:acetyl-CoA carboxylase biotin carboxyl carrier protein [Bacillota bacterium]
MEFEQIKELISLVNSTDITDLEIEDGDFRLRIRQGQVGVSIPAQLTEQQYVTAPPVPVSPAPVEDGHGFVEVVAPMVGTFYRAPAPDADPYVQLGEQVSPGQVLFIIEAMKMMNEIESEVKGVVKQILVENGEPVEYGQPLMLIDPKA